MKLKKHPLVAVGVLCTALGAVAGGLVAAAASTHTPEIDRANANIQLGGNLVPKPCNGEDAPAPYVTYSGTLRGGESQVVPDPTDYVLNGTLTISGIEWTINLNTGRGVLTGKVVLAGGSASTVTVYTGTITLVTQGTPASGAASTARGWISARVSLPDETGFTKDDSLVANVEFPQLSPTGGVGFFGDGSGSGGPNVPDFSVVTNVSPSTTNQFC
jgi:hypothetical protein